MKTIYLFVFLAFLFVRLQAADVVGRHPDLVLLDKIRIGMKRDEVRAIADRGEGSRIPGGNGRVEYYGSMPHIEWWHSPAGTGSIRVEYEDDVVVSKQFWRGLAGFSIPDVIDLNGNTEHQLERIDRLDRAEKPQKRQILVMGDDLVMRWDKAIEKWRGLKVVSRGIETLRIEDLSDFMNRLVVRYQPKVLVISVGEIDIRRGAKPQELLDNTKKLMRSLREKLPETEVLHLSIKPNPRQPQMLEYIRQTNELIAAEFKEKGEVIFVDTFSKLIDSSGFPIGTLFLPCGACLNDAGMKIVNEELKKGLSKTGLAP